jgi:flavin-binding protein dodecin
MFPHGGRDAADGLSDLARTGIIPASVNPDTKEQKMSDSVYRVTEVIGVSADSWEAAARNAVETAAKSIRDLRVAEATRFDVTIKDGQVEDYRVRLDISFKYEAGD